MVKATTDKITLLLNWAATPYHAPIFLAQKLGFFADEGIKVAILEPADPSDVTGEFYLPIVCCASHATPKLIPTPTTPTRNTEIVGSGKVDLGCKAMIHTIAAKARGFDVTSIGTLLDEPFTGVVYIKSNNTITEDFKSLKGRRIGYVGEFGKVIIDALTKRHGMTPADYEAVRVGMNVADAIKRGAVDAGVGLENVQQVELEEWCEEVKGTGAADVGMLRIDELADLGCCCFCSVLYIANDAFLAAHPEKARAFLSAVRRATFKLLEHPSAAYDQFVEMKPHLGSKLHRKMFERSLPYFSRTLENVERDWKKVTVYCKSLGVCDVAFEANMTNKFLPEAEAWALAHKTVPELKRVGEEAGEKKKDVGESRKGDPQVLVR
ncbi:glycylpeptide N-tetradecanoyltransferase [Phlyctochytrium bullatum]|nr:glycylpeptide N-tetradecanoyltransferase [Phlyctochytrium bullatum]